MAKEYCKNRDILREINQAKIDHSTFIDPKFEQFDVIILEPNSNGGRVPVEKLPEKKKWNSIRSTIRKRNKTDVRHRESRIKNSIDLNEKLITDLEKYLKKGGSPYGEFVTDNDINRKIQQTRNEILQLQQDLKNITPDKVVYRIMTYDHVPVRVPDVKPQWASDEYVFTKFPPFVHAIYKDKELITVGKALWEGDMETGTFTNDKGTHSIWLYGLFNKLVEKIGDKPNWRGYSFMDDMKAEAVLRLLMTGLKFNEAELKTPETSPNGIKKTLNAFAYTTSTINNVFRSMLNDHKAEKERFSGFNGDMDDIYFDEDRNGHFAHIPDRPDLSSQ